MSTFRAGCRKRDSLWKWLTCRPHAVQLTISMCSPPKKAHHCHYQHIGYDFSLMKGLRRCETAPLHLYSVHHILQVRCPWTKPLVRIWKHAALPEGILSNLKRQFSFHKIKYWWSFSHATDQAASGQKIMLIFTSFWQLEVCFFPTFSVSVVCGWVPLNCSFFQFHLLKLNRCDNVILLY